MKNGYCTFFECAKDRRRNSLISLTEKSAKLFVALRGRMCDFVASFTRRMCSVLSNGILVFAEISL